MSILDFDISVNHPSNIYTSGQTVRGKVQFKLRTSKIIRGVYVKFRGIARTQWDEAGKRLNDPIVRYHGEQRYFTETLYLVGEGSDELFELPPGEHNYKFAYTLPVGLPTSFKNRFGNITYTITAVINVSWDINVEAETRLLVVSPINLNKRARLKLPGYAEAKKHLWCLWCPSALITIEINIPKTGYVSGETMHVMTDIRNESSTRITMMEYKIDQKITFHSEYPSHRVKQLASPLYYKHFPGVPAFTIKHLDAEIKIPEMIVANFVNCELFEVQQSLKVILHVNGCHTNLMAKIPIKLGNIPVRLDENSSTNPVSITAGLGSPYPYETENQPVNVYEFGAAYSARRYQYGWWLH